MGKTFLSRGPGSNRLNKSASSLAMPPSPASPFAAVLRRSKFVSLDTSISQIYTSSGGDLSRGNWGLKRPLPIRRRGAHITVKAVDSKEQQTEWDVADQQAKWMKMWEEVGITPTPTSGGPWERRLGSKAYSSDERFDSEYSQLPIEETEEVTEAAEGDVSLKGETEVETIPQEPVELSEEERVALEEKRTLLQILDAGPGASMPNIFAMSDSEFEKYLDKVRSLRPTFLAYRKLDAEAKRRNPKETHWTDMQADHGSQLFKTFLEKHAEIDLTAPSSRTIEQQPQQVAGLNYARGSLLQSVLLTPPQPGRLLNKNKDSTRDAGIENVVGFAGMLPTMADKHRGFTSPLDWKRLSTVTPTAPGTEASDFRIVHAALFSAPSVVGQSRNAFRDILIDCNVKAVTEEDLKADNKPGTREYSGSNPQNASTKGSGYSSSASGILKGASSHLMSRDVKLGGMSHVEVEADSVLTGLEGILKDTPSENSAS